MALAESYLIVKLTYIVKDNKNAPNTGDNPYWACPTSPGFSWVKNVLVEINSQEATQNVAPSPIQPVQHILSLMESTTGRVQYVDSDLYGLQKLYPRKSLKALPLQIYEYGISTTAGYPFATNTAGGGDFHDTAGHHKVKRLPTILLNDTKTSRSTVQENIVRASSGNFQYKFRPFIPFYKAGDSRLPQGTDVKIRVDLPNGDLSRYMVISNKGGGADSPNAMNQVRVESLELDFVYPTY